MSAKLDAKCQIRYVNKIPYLTPLSAYLKFMNYPDYNLYLLCSFYVYGSSFDAQSMTT